MITADFCNGICHVPTSNVAGRLSRPISCKVTYRIVGITYSAPALMPVGQRDVTVLRRV